MLPPVFQTLKASADVKALVGTNPPRIYRHGYAPEGVEKPYITWSLIVGDPHNNLSDTPPSDRLSVQVDCWHRTDSGIEIMAQAVRDAIEPVAHMTSIDVDQRDPVTLSYRISMSFDFITSR